MSYDRYAKFRINGGFKIVPGITLAQKTTDKFEQYVANKTRLDLVSYKYYRDPNYDWLIMVANPEYGSMEFAIPDGETIRIPYPLDETLKEYVSKVDTYNRLYS